MILFPSQSWARTLPGGLSLIVFILGGLGLTGVPALVSTDAMPLIFGCLVFLFPLASYCLFLAMLNGRQHPTLISGPWDFVGILLALSGFLLVGGPTVLNSFHSRWRASLVRGELPMLGRLGGDHWYFWLLLWSIYFLVILGGALWVLRRRRGITLVYNIEPNVLGELLFRVFGQLKLESSRTANRFLIHRAPEEMAAARLAGAQDGFREEDASARLALGIAANTVEGRDVSAGQATLELDPFAAMHHVTMHWRGDDLLRRDVETELGRQLAEVVVPDNPAAGWLLTVATCLFGGLLLGLVAFLLLLTRR